MSSNFFKVTGQMCDEHLYRSLFENYSERGARELTASELQDPTFGDKVDGIGEVDPYGARLVSLLARSRLQNPSIRVSTLIT